MSKYRHRLPQLYDSFITDGGMETTLIYHEGIDLPAFASFVLLKDAAGVEALRRYFMPYVELARAHRVGIVLETMTWRASPDWGRSLGYDAAALARVNRDAIEVLSAIRTEYETDDTPIVISGNLGPRGDGYVPDRRMSVREAQAYHGPQVCCFAETEADMVAAFTMNYPGEAIGIVLAAKGCGMPVAISFTVETDGRLPSGETLADAIRLTDEASDGYPAYYMINCAHPDHFEHVLDGEPVLRERIRGLRANASRCSHAELDVCTELDSGNPEELGRQYQALRERLPRLSVFGGCCGTDHRHLAAICDAVLDPAVRGSAIAAACA